MPLHKPAMLLHDTHTKLKGVERFLPFQVSFPLSTTCSFSATPKRKQCMSRFSTTSPHQNPHGKGRPPKPNLICVGFTFGWGTFVVSTRDLYLILRTHRPHLEPIDQKLIKIGMSTNFSKKFNAVSFINSNLNLLLELFHKKLYIYNILITNYRR